MTGPPVDRWAEDEALRALARLAVLPDVDPDEARRRLDRLTEAQRAVIEDALRRATGGRLK